MVNHLNKMHSPRISFLTPPLAGFFLFVQPSTTQLRTALIERGGLGSFLSNGIRLQCSRRPSSFSGSRCYVAKPVFLRHEPLGIVAWVFHIFSWIPKDVPGWHAAPPGTEEYWG